MALLSDRDARQVREILETLEGPVTIHFFTQDFECGSCSVVHELLREVSGLSGQLNLKVYDFMKDGEAAKKLGVDKIPAIVLEGPKSFQVRFFGVPSGYEFMALLDDLADVARGTTRLSEETVAWLKELTSPIHIQVFVTPTCPYCPRAVRMAHQLAIQSPWVSADMVSANEFPHLTHRYDVMAVPKIVVNEGTVQFEGALPEREFVRLLRRVGEAPAAAMYR